MAAALQAPILANSPKSRSYQKDTVRFPHGRARGGQTSEALHSSFLKGPCPEGQLNEQRVWGKRAALEGWPCPEFREAPFMDRFRTANNSSGAGQSGF
jgi:hypothetical protein